MQYKRKSYFVIAGIFFLLLGTGAARSAELEIGITQGQAGYAGTVTVAVGSLDFNISGFNLVLAVDQHSYAVTLVTPGPFFDDCGWEYFTYRIIHDSAQYYDLHSYTDLVTVTALASVSAGHTPGCFGLGSGFDLVHLECLIRMPYPVNDLECEFLPIRFYWRGCGDNVLYSQNGDTVYTAAELYDPGDTVPASFTFPGFGVPDPPCVDPPGQTAVNSLVLRNGGIDILCPFPLHSKGDVNLNGIRYEVADLILAIDYFLRGMIVFTISSAAQLDQLDINNDGMVSIPDMILLTRIVVGDMPPILGYWKLSPQSTAALRVSGRNIFTLDVPDDVGAVYLRLLAEDGHALSVSEVAFSGPEFRIGQIGDTTTMLLINTEGGAVLPAGSHELFSLGDAAVQAVEVQIGDVTGRAFKLEYSATIPETFVLKQNYPNPFNPATRIGLALPRYADWNLTIYNVAGQLVREFSGRDIGSVEIIWDGRDSRGTEVASGVYFYRVDADGQFAVRKMLLLK